jgi:O-antigen ligase
MQEQHAPDDSPSLRAVRFLVQAWVFLLVLALYPYTANPSGPIKHLLTGWAVFAMCAVYLYGMAREGLGLRVTGGAVALLFAFLGIHVVSALTSDFPLNSLYSLRLWLCGGVLALIAGNSFRTPDQLWKLLLVIVVAVSLSSVYGYLQKFGLDPFPWSARNIEEYAGMPSTYANPNFAGHTLVLALLMALGLLAFRGNLACLLAVALIGSHLYLTHMRGARVALAAAGLVLALHWLLCWRGRGALRAGVMTLLLLLAGAATAIAGGIAYASSQGDGPVPLDSPSVLRLNGYYGAARMALDHPVLGAGPGNYDLESPRYWTPFEQRWYATEGKKNDHVHNDALETAADAGFTGVALYFALLIWGVLSGLTLAGSAVDPGRSRLGYVLAACFAAFAVDGLFGFNLRVPVSAGLFFLALGLLQALQHGPVARRWWHVPVLGCVTLGALGLALASTLGFYADARHQEARGAQAYAEEQRAAGNLGR